LGRYEAKFLVDFYYTVQDNRIRSDAQVREHSESGEPNKVVEWCGENFRVFENNIKNALNAFSDSYIVGQWMRSICGIGPVISAGLLAYIDIKKAPTYGHIWRYAGLDATVIWPNKDSLDKWFDVYVPEGHNPHDTIKLACTYFGRNYDTLVRYMTPEGKTLPTINNQTLKKAIMRRPWNAELKVLTVFKLGECFVKVQGNEKDFYGQIYRRRKDRELEMNLDKKFKDQADRQLAEKKIGKTTDCYKHLKEGMLPPAQIHARARRYAVKLFLAHLHHVMFEDFNGHKPRIPFPFEKLRHDEKHYIPVPNWPSGDYEGRKLTELID